MASETVSNGSSETPSNILSSPGYVDHDLATGCVYVRVKGGPLAETRDFGETCQVLIDYNDDGDIMGYEIRIPDVDGVMKPVDTKRQKAAEERNLRAIQKATRRKLQYAEDADFRAKEQERNRDSYRRRKKREETARLRSLSQGKGDGPPEAKPEVEHAAGWEGAWRESE